MGMLPQWHGWQPLGSKRARPNSPQYQTVSAQPSTPSVRTASRAPESTLTPRESGSAKQTGSRGSAGGQGSSPTGGELSRAVQSSVPRLRGSSLPGSGREMPRAGVGGAGNQRPGRDPPRRPPPVSAAGGERRAAVPGPRRGAARSGLILSLTPASRPKCAFQRVCGRALKRRPGCVDANVWDETFVLSPSFPPFPKS